MKELDALDWYLIAGLDGGAIQRLIGREYGDAVITLMQHGYVELRITDEGRAALCDHNTNPVQPSPAAGRIGG